MEQERIPYSSKTYIPDFTFDDIGCVVEAKLCDSIEREKQMVAEINDDIMAYSTRYKSLIFVVYDTGFIRDSDKFRQSIISSNVAIEIIKH